MSDKLIRIVTKCEHGSAWRHVRLGDCDGGSVVDLTREEAITIMQQGLHSMPFDNRYDHERNGAILVDALLGVRNDRPHTR